MVATWGEKKSTPDLLILGKSGGKVDGEKSCSKITLRGLPLIYTPPSSLKKHHGTYGTWDFHPLFE